jgi:hypothetical protein
MSILALFQPLRVQTSGGGVVVIEQFLDLAQRNAQLVEGMGRGVSGHMRFAGPDMLRVDLFDGLDRELFAAAAVVGKGHPDRPLFLLIPVRAIQVSQVWGTDKFNLHEKRIRALEKGISVLDRLYGFMEVPP